MEVVLLSGADADLTEIFAKLDESGKGEKFLADVDRKLALLQSFPALAPPSRFGKLRKASITKTPYALYYAIEGKRLMVIAIQDTRQDAGTIARIIRSRL